MKIYELLPKYTGADLKLFLVFIVNNISSGIVITTEKRVLFEPNEKIINPNFFIEIEPENLVQRLKYISIKPDKAIKAIFETEK